MRTAKNLNSLRYFLMRAKNRGGVQKSLQALPKLSARLCLKRHSTAAAQAR